MQVSTTLDVMTPYAGTCSTPVSAFLLAGCCLRGPQVSVRQQRGLPLALWGLSHAQVSLVVVRSALLLAPIVRHLLRKGPSHVAHSSFNRSSDPDGSRDTW